MHLGSEEKTTSISWDGIGVFFMTHLGKRQLEMVYVPGILCMGILYFPTIRKCEPFS